MVQEQLFVAADLDPKEAVESLMTQLELPLSFYVYIDMPCPEKPREVEPGFYEAMDIKSRFGTSPLVTLSLRELLNYFPIRINRYYEKDSTIDAWHEYFTECLKQVDEIAQSLNINDQISFNKNPKYYAMFNDGKIVPIPNVFFNFSTISLSEVINFHNLYREFFLKLSDLFRKEVDDLAIRMPVSSTIFNWISNSTVTDLSILFHALQKAGYFGHQKENKSHATLRRAFFGLFSQSDEYYAQTIQDFENKRKGKEHIIHALANATNV